MKENTTNGTKNGSRRTFLNKLTGGVLGLGATVASWPMIRSLFPNVLYEPPQRFRIGKPEVFQMGVTFLEERKIFLVREQNNYRVVSGVCTHLGCTVKFSPFQQPREIEVRNNTFTALGEFHCPCHGSRFHGDGTNYSGPAPRPLQWFSVELSPNDGSLVVDLGNEVDRDTSLVV